MGERKGIPCDMIVQEALYRPLRNPDKAWRFQWLNLDLDLLQCAVCVKDEYIVKEFLRRNVVNNDHYKGPSGSKNHPVHLACAFGHRSIFAILLEFFGDVEEGEITVSWVRTALNRGRICLPQSEETLHANTLQLAEKQADSLVVLYNFYFKQATCNPDGVSLISIEQVWNVLDRIFEETNTWDMYKQVLVSLRSTWENALPVLQRVCTMPWPDDPAFGRSLLKFLIGLVSSCSSRFVSNALSFMTCVQLQNLVEASDPCHHCSGSHRSGNPTAPDWRCTQVEKMLGLVQTELQDRTLQQECMLAVLQSVGGNSVRTMDIPMPRGLRRLFRVPFWDEWLALTSVESKELPDTE